MFARSRYLIRTVRRNPGRSAALMALLTLIGAGLGLGLMQGWAAWQYHLAEKAYERREFGPAYDHYAQVLRIWAGRGGIHLEAARAARRAQLFSKAQEHLDRFQELSGGARGVSADLQLERFLLRAQTGDLDPRTEEMLWSAVKAREPSAPLILEALARGYRSLMRWDAARACLRELVLLEPDHAWAHAELGYLVYYGSSTTEAIPHFRKALELQPGNHEARLSLARALITLDPSEARTHFEYLRRKAPSSAVFLGLAQAYRGLAENEKALATLNEALEKDPDAGGLWTERGTLLIAMGKAAQAEADLRKAVAVDPLYPVAQFQLARALELQGGEEREAEAKRCVVRGKQAEEANNRLAHLANNQMSRDSHNPALYHEVGELFLRGREKDLGLMWLYRALKVDPEYQPTHRLLARYYEEKGDQAMAARHRAHIRPEPEKSAARPSPRS